MISPVAIVLALQFLAPYTPDHRPPCQGALDLQVYAAATRPGVDGWAYMGGGCQIHISDEAEDYPPQVQCALIAHELGHSVFSLGHQAGTIMDPSTDTRPIPGGCYPPRHTHRRSHR